MNEHPSINDISKITIRSTQKSSLKELLELHDYLVEEVQEGLYKVVRDAVEVFVSIQDKNIFFQLEVGNLKDLEDQAIYKDLLNLNTEILPVSLGLDTTSNDARLVILESRETENLDENEILTVFEAMEIALFKVENLLKKYIKKN